MTTHKRVGDTELRLVWERAARAKASQMKSEGTLHATMCHYATDNSLKEDDFTQRTKRMEEAMMEAAKSEDAKKAVRSSASSVRSVVAAALDQGRTLVRDGKPVGKSRLEQEKKACTNGHTASAVMDAKTDDLRHMASGGVGVTRAADGSTAKDAANVESDVVMNVRDNLSNFLATASDSIVQDLAYELLRCEERLSNALCEESDAYRAEMQKKAA